MQKAKEVEFVTQMQDLYDKIRLDRNIGFQLMVDFTGKIKVKGEWCRSWCSFGPSKVIHKPERTRDARLFNKWPQNLYGQK